jgi:hypothetical protein
MKTLIGKLLPLFLSLLIYTCGYAVEGVTEEKPFVIVIPSHNNREWYQQNLDSVFNQNYRNYRVIYIADASTEGTERFVESYVAQNHQEKRFTLLKNKEQRGVLACLCQAIFSCNREEIVVPLEGADWLAHNEVLSTLNAVYADPDVWMTCSQTVSYPSFSRGQTPPIPDEVIKTSEVRNWTGDLPPVLTFYAAVFQEIDKLDFLHEGHFFPGAGDLAWQLPLVEMSGEHLKFLPEVLSVCNETPSVLAYRATGPQGSEIEKKIRGKPKYFPLPELPLHPMAPPASIYRQIKEITHPTLNDYRFVQNYLQIGQRETLKRLGNMERGLREIKLVGSSPEEIPCAGSIHLNCDIGDRENCILLYTTFNRNYPKGLKRLLKEIINSDYQGHVLYRFGGWPDEEGGSLALSHVPYAFKPSFFKEAQKMGFKRVLWLDTAVVPIAPLNEIFAMIEEKGYFVMGNTHMIGPYMNPQSAAYFGLTVAQTHKIPSCSAGLFGLDLTQSRSRTLLDLWYRAAFDKDAYFSQRSDQNALSMLLDQFQMGDLTDISRMPHAETADPIRPDSLFYLDRLFIR